MAFKKVVRGEAEMVIMGGGNQKVLFPVGYRYLFGDRVYEVRDRYFSDNTEWRRLHCSDGSVEDVTVDTIIEDFKSAGGDYKHGVHNPKGKAFIKVLHDPDNLPEPEPEPVAAAPKKRVVAKRKPAKAKAKPKAKAKVKAKRR